MHAVADRWIKGNAPEGKVVNSLAVSGDGCRIIEKIRDGKVLVHNVIFQENSHESISAEAPFGLRIR